MTVLQRNDLQGPITQAKMKDYWVKVYVNNPFSIHFLGPYHSHSQAHSAQEDYVTQIESEGKKVASCFEIFSVSRPKQSDYFMDHAQWLQALMEDYLHIKIP